MKTVYVVRHGKAVGATAEMPDYDRTLVEIGCEDARNLGVRLSERFVRPSHVFSSPAPRALETAKIIMRALPITGKRVRTRKALYGQTETAFAAIIASLDDEADSVMIVGHNPSVEEFVRSAVDGFTDRVPTCGAVGIQWNCETWDEVTPGGGKIVLFETPKTIAKPLGKKDLRKNIERTCNEAVASMLSDIDSEVFARVRKDVKKAVSRIAKPFVDALAKKRKKERKAASGGKS